VIPSFGFRGSGEIDGTQAFSTVEDIPTIYIIPDAPAAMDGNIAGQRPETIPAQSGDPRLVGGRRAG